MSLETETRIALNGVIDPELGRSIVELGMVRDLQVSNGSVSFTLALTSLARALNYPIVEEAFEAISKSECCQDVTINLVKMVPEERQKPMGAGKRRVEAADQLAVVDLAARAEGGPVQTGVSGTVQQAVEAYRAGRLECAERPSMPDYTN